MLLTILLSVLATLVVALLASNITSNEPRVQHRVPPVYGVDDDQFEYTMSCLMPPAFVGGNRVEPFENGDSYFPRMLQDIRLAEKCICMESFIFWSGRVGEQFARALGERAQAGVSVYVVIDWVGSFKAPRSFIRQMRDNGVKVALYRTPWRFLNWPHFNSRTHRKILVVDGSVGWTGGAGIADSWRGKADDTRLWRDSQYRVTGPVVAQLQAAFMDNWLQTSAEVLHGPAFFPRLAPIEASTPEEQADAEARAATRSQPAVPPLASIVAEMAAQPTGFAIAGPAISGVRAQFFMSGPEEGIEGARLLYLLSITAARRRILLSHAYFVPDDLCISALCEARKRGVRVQIIIPGPTDSYVTLAATFARIGRLLRAGVEIHQYRGAMFHRKAMVVDDRWTSVGSVNFDNRSFRLNDEIVLNVIDVNMARYMAKVFEADLANTSQVTREEYARRPAWRKAVQWSAALMRSQM